MANGGRTNDVWFGVHLQYLECRGKEGRRRGRIQSMEIHLGMEPYAHNIQGMIHTTLDTHIIRILNHSPKSMNVGNRTELTWMLKDRIDSHRTSSNEYH